MSLHRSEMSRCANERSFSGDQRMADFDQSGSQPPRDFVPLAAVRQGRANVPFPDGLDRSAAADPGQKTDMTPMPGRADPCEKIQEASSASIGNSFRCGGGFPLKTKRRRAS